MITLQLVDDSFDMMMMMMMMMNLDQGRVNNSV